MGKTTAAHRLQKKHYERNTTMGKTQRQRPLAPLLCHTAVTVEATTSLSLSLTHSLTHSIQLHAIQLYSTTLNVFNYINALCPKSYLYTYDFRAIYTYGPKGPTRTHLHMCPLPSPYCGYYEATTSFTLSLSLRLSLYTVTHPVHTYN